jgi:MFS family permease
LRIPATDVRQDNTIIATGIPRITDQFHALDDVGWYGSAYLLTATATQLLFGKIYTHLNIKAVYLSAIVLFEIGSLICGAAPTSTALILGRAIAGLGSAGGVVIISHAVPLERRPIYVGIVGAMYGVAAVVGPLMGGAFTDHISWRLCFYVNLPIGAMVILGIILFFKAHDKTHEEPRDAKTRLLSLDPIGTVVFMPSIICLLIALQWGGSKYPWHDARIIALLVVFVVLIVIFIVVQIKNGENATTPLRIISQRSIAFGCWYTFSVSLCIGGMYRSGLKISMNTFLIVNQPLTSSH